MTKGLTINWIGNFNSGYVGELGDSVHLVKSLEEQDCIVRKVPQDVWKAYCDGEVSTGWIDKLPRRADINIVTKWHHFNNRKYIDKLRNASDAPVFYWVWDYMQGEEWHANIIDAVDLYLGNDVRNPWYEQTDNAYYFPFDVADGTIPTFQKKKKYDVVFFGSWEKQGDRQGWLVELNRHLPVKVFSWNWQDWPTEFEASPPVYGEEFNEIVGQSKIILGFSVEPNCWGYWSNRVGKTLLAGGFLLYQYAPGMELFLRDGVEYFSSIEEAKEKIDHYLIADDEREKISLKGHMIGAERFSSEERIKDLIILIERFLKTGGEGWKI